jgi:hypothetical protein
MSMSLDEWMIWQENVDKFQTIMIGIVLLIAIFKR